MKDTNKKNNIKHQRLYVPVTVCMTFIIAVFGMAVFFRVTHIEIIGCEKYKPEEILTYANLKKGDNLLLYDKGAAIKKIDAALPYVGNIHISRVLPGTVKIEVTERRVTAAIMYNGAHWLLDSNLRLLESQQEEPVNTVIISGVLLRSPEVGRQLSINGDASGTRRDTLSEILTSLEDMGLIEKVTVLDMTNIGSITFEYDNRMTVIIGAGSDMPQKLVKFINNLGNIAEDFQGKVDLTGDGVRTYA